MFLLGMPFGLLDFLSPILTLPLPRYCKQIDMAILHKGTCGYISKVDGGNGRFGWKNICDRSSALEIPYLGKAKHQLAQQYIREELGRWGEVKEQRFLSQGSRIF